MNTNDNTPILKKYKTYFDWWLDNLKGENPQKIQRFKDKLYSFKTEEEWYKFRDELFCKAHFREFN